MIGDSIVSGASIGKPERLLGAQMAQRMNWDFIRDGFGGSGYVAKGNQPDQGPSVDQAFQTRLPNLIKADPDVVIIAGGRNDMYFPIDDVEAAAVKFLSDIRAALPDSKIVTIGGWRWKTTQEARWVDTQAEMSQVLRAATEKVGGVYVDPAVDLAPITDELSGSMLAADLFHPTEDGHAYLGRDLAYELVERGLPRGPEIWKPKGLSTGEFEDATDAYFAAGR
ncbi:UNVERIFIED_ORG: lysophospholipase L1-like esterase [Paenarthrobacter nicotinovorans]